MATNVIVIGKSFARALIRPEPVIQVNVRTSPVVKIKAFAGGVLYNDSPDTAEYQIALGVDRSNPQTFKEFPSYDGDGNLLQMDVWDSSSKNTKLFTKTFTYNSGVLTQMTIVNELAGVTVNRTFTYSGDDLVSVDDVVV